MKASFDDFSEKSEPDKIFNEYELEYLIANARGEDALIDDPELLMK